jgi:glycosyltransferase involved in cell wall biosynthesis
VHRRNLRILYDGRVFQFQKAGGVNRIYAEVITGLPAEYHPLITGVEEFGRNVPRHPNLEQPRFKLFRPRRISVPMRERWWKPRLLDSLDLFHPTYYDLTDGFCFSDFKCPTVVTVYDFIYAIYRKLIQGSEGVIRNQTEAIRNADHVICISKATENNLLERFPEKQGRTSVIYPGSSFEIQTPLTEQAIFEKPSFLFVGHRAGYKNFFFLLRALAKASRTNPRIRLRVVGAPLSTEERWQIQMLGISGRVEAVTYPDDQQLINLYRSSVALLYPSLHEGFGMPPLEAMACRTLSITSNTTSLPEVMGDVGIMLDPTREADWVECILKTAKEGGDRDLIIERGLERVRNFSWKSTVDRHLDVYRRLV